ncbi:MAG: hypothetical protein OXU77_22775 [Gammaproteobacteria bacterium]|nr:hypothetical protein [Gammaproteobacteria bacterium]
MVREFEITGTATAPDAPSILRFVRSRRPTETSPIALAFDDLGPVGSDLWNILVRELRGLAVYLLGSTRQEDHLALISNQSDTDVIHVQLDAALAQSLWEKAVVCRGDELDALARAIRAIGGPPARASTS